MTYEQALKICGKQPHWALKNMVKALGMHSWLNTAADNERLEAATICLEEMKRKRR